MKALVLEKFERYGEKFAPGDEVYFVCDMWDPRMNRGVIKKIYDTNPERENDLGIWWEVKCTIEDRNGNTCPNIQARRIAKVESTEADTTSKEPCSENEAKEEAMNNVMSWAMMSEEEFREADQSIERKLNKSEDYDLGRRLRNRFIKEVQSDEDGPKEFERFLHFYKELSREEKSFIDGTLIYLCGWSLPTLLDKVR